MKYLLIAIMLPVFSFAQQKGDTKISVLVSDTSGLFNRVASVLLDKDYTIESNDRALGIIYTGVKHIKYADVKFWVRIVGQTIVFTGELDGTYPIEFGGMRNSPRRSSWNEMNAIASGFGKVSYSR